MKFTFTSTLTFMAKNEDEAWQKLSDYLREPQSNQDLYEVKS